MTLAKWYFCVNERGFDKAFPLMVAAVGSARANTALHPVCLYNGANERHVERLAALGVEVLRHRSSLEADLRAGYGERYDTFSGHWLRIDIPLVERDEEIVLYTDTDVMFLAPPRLAAAPRLIAAAPEFELADLTYFSSGVLVMNVPRLRRLHDRFAAAIRTRLRRDDFLYPAHDQESYNRFFGPTALNRLRRRAFTPMDPALNWKPFWGLNNRASIVHFHGPKPRQVRRLAELGDRAPMSDGFKSLWRRAPEAYEAYARLWEAYGSERPRRP
jgi:hypothetical protein